MPKVAARAFARSETDFRNTFLRYPRNTFPYEHTYSGGGYPIDWVGRDPARCELFYFFSIHGVRCATAIKIMKENRNK